MKKNFTKILLVMPAFVIAASCAKEMASVQEPAPADDADGKVFTTEFEDVKTILDASRTPVWVDGDAIGVTTSTDNNVRCPLLDIEKGIFGGDGVKGTAPFYAVYPYSEDNTFNGSVLTATIPSVQTLSNGQNVAPGALVTACRSDSRTLAFKNCVSLLQITIPLPNVKKVVVTATKAGEYLTGKFTMDLSENPLAPALVQSAAYQTVTLQSEGETFAPGTYYITVAPVTLNAIRIDFTNTSDETVSVSKTAKTVLERSAGSNLGNFFIYEISTAEDLIKWAKQSSKFTTWDVVTVKADIELTPDQAASYVEAKDFSGVFDARKPEPEDGNYRIKGLTKPLFEEFRGVCEGVDLESDIVYDGSWGKNKPGCGIFSQYLSTFGRTTVKVSNVNTYGSIEFNFAATRDSYFNMGGIVGATNGAPISNCTNHADIYFTKLVLTGDYATIGGVVGSTQDGAVLANVTDCKNYGAITIRNTAAIGKPLYCGGIVGYSTRPVTYENLENHGAIIMTSESRQQGNRILGGIMGYTVQGITIRNCKNDAPITLTPGSDDTSNNSVAGGIFGYAAVPSVPQGTPPPVVYVTIEGCTNTANGTILMSGKSSYSCPGGIVGWSAATMNVIGCTNNAAITFKGSSDKDLRMGGIIGNCANSGGVTKSLIGSAQSGCSNTGTITNEGGAAVQAFIGGILGCSGSKSTDVTNCHNTGNIINNSTAAMTTSLCMGGITGYSGTALCVYEDCTSKCEIVRKESQKHKAVYAGMIHGQANTDITAQHNGLGGKVLGKALTQSNFKHEEYYYGAVTGSKTYTIDPDSSKQSSYFIQ